MATYKGVVPSGKYTFNAAAKTITFDADYTGIALSDIMLITNVKSGTAITIYDPFDPAKGGSLTGLVLTLNYNTTSMSNSDPLQVIVGMVNLPTSLPTGAATETTLSSINTKIPSLGQALAAGSVPVVLTAAQLSTLTPLSSISVSNFPATQPISGSISNTSFGISGTLPAFASIPTFKIDQTTPGTTNKVDIGTNGTVAITGSVGVTGTFWQTTQPVSLASVPTHAVTQSGTWTVGLSAGSNAIGSITNTSFAATQSTASSLLNKPYGAVSTSAPTYTNATDNALSLTIAGALRVDGSGVTQPVSIASSVAVTGTFYQATQPVSIASSVAVTGPLTDTQLRASAVPVSLASLPSLAAGSNAIGSITNTSFVATQATAANLNATVSLAASQTLSTVSTVTNLSQLNGTAISMNSGVRDAGTQRVTIATNDSVPVTGTFWQTTQPVSLASLPSLAAGTNAIGSITNTSFASTQSGTWTVQPGNTANTTPWLTKLSDGTNAVAIKAASTAPLATDPALVVGISPNSSLPISSSDLTSIKTNTDNLALAQGSTTSGQKGNLVMGAVSSTALSPTTNTTSPLSLTTAGELRVGSDGCTSYQAVSANTTNLVLIKAGSTKVYGWYIYNNSTAIKKVTLYDSATSGAITVGGTNPLITLVIPATSGANVSLPIPLAVTNGLCIAMTGGAVASTTMQNSDATVVQAYDLNVNILYK
jgi:hypothetical protein